MAATHRVKVISFRGRDVPIVMQNENGPCPLLALSNVLLLRNQIRLTPLSTEVSQETLLSQVAGVILDANNPDRFKESSKPDSMANLQRNVADAVSKLHLLTTGLDVNPFFEGSIRGFEVRLAKCCLAYRSKRIGFERVGDMS